MKKRIEKDSIGEIEVDANVYWGASTQRSIQHFHIHTERMPKEVIYALAHIKKACALANYDAKKLTCEKKDAIVEVCDEILSKTLDSHFPLSLWQTGSGTQTNMNVNEVIANRANALAKKKWLHPNDDVNLSQSSNDTFPTAMHLSTYLLVKDKLIPSLTSCIHLLKEKESQYQNVIKIGRTHLQDATPLYFHQEISGWRSMLENNVKLLYEGLQSIQKLAIGGTAVGTGLNAPYHFDRMVCQYLNQELHTNFIPDENKFHALSSKDDILHMHSCCKNLATNLLKIANDIRFLASGPRCNLAEITIPSNEPGSSIMPGKVNPTQCEALTMICAQVFGNDTTITFAASQGNFQLNVYMPVIIYNMLQSIHLLAEGIASFQAYCLQDLQPNIERMQQYVDESLMCVTVLTPHIGYEAAANCAKYAFQNNISLRQACLDLQILSLQEFESYMKVESLIPQPKQ